MTEANQESTKRNYKDSLFRRIFAGKKELLELYNGVNGTDYKNADELMMNTLDNAVYLNIKNDLSFIFDFQMNLYEHQSTYNGNMPLRYLYFVTKLYQPMIGEGSLYTTKRKKIPAPKFVVFYNGVKDMPERWIEKLSDSFEKPVEEPGLELTVLVLNVNYGKNQELMEQCRTLREYALYVARVREYAEKLPIADAVEKAVVECIDEDILAVFLRKYRAEAVQMSILEYNEERELRLLRQEERDDGREEGRAEGREEGKREGKTIGKTIGKTEMLVSIIKKKLQKGMEVKEIADILEVDLEKVMQVTDFITNNPQLQDDEIAIKIMEEND
ncbi:transposase [Lachnospiraceae bacterium OttesenSCG-928-D06]|nr:transposase [Lachnospiraceae bacterium OttesenSCG-928-D06]